MEQDGSENIQARKKSVDRLAIQLPDGSLEPLAYVTMARYSLKAGSKAPFTKFPIVLTGKTRIRFDELGDKWIEDDAPEPVSAQQ